MPTSGYALPIAVLLALGAVLSAWRVVRARRGFGIIRQTDAAHLFMNASMALMFTPWYRAGLGAVVIALYVLLALACFILFAVTLRRRGRDWAARLGTYAYHLMVTLAMLYIIAAVPAPSTPAMPGMAMPSSAPPTLLAALIGVGFLLDAVVTAVTVTFFPNFAARAGALAGQVDDETSLASFRQAAIPHVIMDIGMVFMVVAMTG